MNYRLKHSLPGRIRFLLPACNVSWFSCEALAEQLLTHPGVESVRINRYARSVVVHYSAGETAVPQRIAQALASAKVRDFRQKRLSSPQNRNAAKSGQGWLGLSLCALAAAATGVGSGVLTPLVLISGIPSYRRAYQVLAHERRLNVDFLDSIVVGSSVLWGETVSGALVAFLVNLGEWIREFTAARSRRKIEDALGFKHQKAWVIRDGKKKRVPVEVLTPGDTIAVYVGEMIPVDGVVIRSHGTVDQKTITGESLPVEKRDRDEVFAGTVLVSGKLSIEAKRVGAQTLVAGIVKTVESAPIGETRMQNYAERFADRLVLPFIALASGLYAFTGDRQRFLSTLIVDYGTGMRVAAPSAMLACMIRAAREGVLVKSGAHLERLERVDTILFDKTGTLTCGSPRILDVHSYHPSVFPPETILSLAAASEARYRHPVAAAVLAKAREQHVKWLDERQHSRFEVGSGVEANINGYFVQIGSERFMTERQIGIERARDELRKFELEGCSSLLVAVNGEVVGVLSYSDQIRPEVPGVIRKLRRYKRFELMMLTGDSEAVAKRVARTLGLDRWFSETLPADKAGIVEQLQKAGRAVAMVGDGINDSPALSRADVGISMRNGSDLTRETAQIVLVEEDMRKLITALETSQRAVRLIRQNWKIIAGLNTLALLATLPGGLVSAGAIAFLSNGSSILGILNGLRPLLSSRPS